MTSRRIHREFLPLCVKGRSSSRVVCSPVRVFANTRDLGHGRNAHDTFDREIALIGEPTGKVVSRELVTRSQRVESEIGGESAQERVVGSKVRGIVGESIASQPFNLR